MKLAFITLALFFAVASNTYATEAVDLTSDEVTSIIKGKKLNTDNTRWGAVQLDFKDNGKLYGNNSSGHSDSGKWRVEDGKLCLQWYRWDYKGCGKVQRIGNNIQHLSPNGKVHFIAKP